MCRDGDGRAGGDASGTTGAGAGIEVPSGSKLTIKGEGRIFATGGNGGNGGACGAVDVSGPVTVIPRGGAGGAAGKGGAGGEWGVDDGPNWYVGFGGGNKGAGGTVTINGGRVTALGRDGGKGIGTAERSETAEGRGVINITGGTVKADGGSGETVTIDGGSVKTELQGQPKNSARKDVCCVNVEVKKLRVEKLRVEGLVGYGTKDIVPIDGRLYLYLLAGTHRFSISDGQMTLRYCAVVKGRKVTVESLPPKTKIGFFVNDEDVGFDGSGDGWAYDDTSKKLLLDGTGPYVLSGSAEKGEVQIRIVRDGATVVLSNAVVFAQDCPVLSVESNASLLMAGDTSCLATTNSASGTVPAVTVAAGATLTVNLLSTKDRLESMICVFDFDAANAIGGGGKVEVNGGTFFVWSDAPAFASGTGIECGEGVVMKTGDDPETAKFADKADEAPCVLVAPVVTVTVANDIPHVSNITVSNAVEQIKGEEIGDLMIYRVMLEDDVFVGYTVDAGYVSQVGNPLAYFAVEDENITIDASTVLTARIIPYRAWNEGMRQMEDLECTGYTVVTADTATFEDDKWYVVTEDVTCGTIAVEAQVKNARGQEVYCVKGSGIRDQGCRFGGVWDYGCESG